VLTLTNPQVLTMTSREIADLSGKNHADVMRDTRVMLVSLEIDPSRFADIFFDAYKRSQPCFRLPKREAFILVSGYNVVMRAKIVDRWQELENAASSPALPDFTNPVAAARAWADAIEQTQALALENSQKQKQIEAAAPAVAFVEQYVETEGSKGIRESAIQLSANERRFTEFLENKNIMYRLRGRLTPFRHHLDSGHFECKIKLTAGGEKPDYRFTLKGFVWVARIWQEHIRVARPVQMASTLNQRALL
jgi:phage antirepressor YoqD-like protein